MIAVNVTSGGFAGYVYAQAWYMHRPGICT